MPNSKLKPAPSTVWAHPRSVAKGGRRGRKLFWNKFIADDSVSGTSSIGSRYSRGSWDFNLPSNGRRSTLRLSSWSSGSFNRQDEDMHSICYACEGLTGNDLPEYHSVDCKKTQANQESANKGVSSSSFNKTVSEKSHVGAKTSWIFGAPLDPTSPVIKTCNRIFLLSRGLGAFIDPLFLYLLAIDRGLSCLYVHKGFAMWVTILRTAIDILFLCHIWMQLKLAYVSKKSRKLGPGQGLLVFNARKIATHYLASFGFFIDVMVITPTPQLIFWVLVPRLMREGRTETIVTVVLIAFCCQLLFKSLHLLMIVRRMRLVTGYVFGTAMWGFLLNVLAYYIAAHVAGSCWYLLAIQRVEHCLSTECSAPNCTPEYLGCPSPVHFGAQHTNEPARVAWAQNVNVTNRCLTSTGGFNWGIYSWAVPLIIDSSVLEKILYPMFWGVMTLSSFGNALAPSNHMLEVIFSLTVITCGLLLFTLLIGNIQVFLHSITAKKEVMQLQMRDLEWWMRRRQLPQPLRQRVRQYERQRWAAMRGLDESTMVSLLPDGLRRDIKKQLCVELVRQVPLFHKMEDALLTQICDRLKHIFFIKDDAILKEGELITRMLIIARGKVQSVDNINGRVYTTVLGPGNFCGEELLQWCIEDPQNPHLPSSSMTLTCLDFVEAFEFHSQDLIYIAQQYHHAFLTDKLKHSSRFYSFHWRAWAACKIQLAWRRSKAIRVAKANMRSLADTHVSANLSVERAHSVGIPGITELSSNDEDRLRMLTAMFTPKPRLMFSH